MSQCKECDGRGTIDVQAGPNISDLIELQCPLCGGSGRYDPDKRAKRRRDEVYAAVKNARPDLYEHVVQIASTSELDLRHAAMLEYRIMGLIAVALGLR